MSRYANHPVLGPATTFLSEFKDEVDNHSDGWAYWKAPLQAAAQLMTLIQSGKADVPSLTKAMAPIKAFMTRKGLAAGMTMPKLVIKKNASVKLAEIDMGQYDAAKTSPSGDKGTPKFDAGLKKINEEAGNLNPDEFKEYLKQGAKKKADAVQPDYAEAKSKVVSPDTVDSTIQQPTKSVEEAAKVGAKKTAIDWGKYTQDEDGGIVDRRDFKGDLSKYCASCDEPLGGYHEPGTLCDDCRGASTEQTAEFENMGGLLDDPEALQQAITDAELEQKYWLADLLKDYQKTVSKTATVGVQSVKVVNPEALKEAADKHKHKCPECGETLTCNNPRDCPGKGKPALCGSCTGTGEKKKKKGADVSGDISDAKSEVVSPDTVDGDIQQPTKSVEEAAKVATFKIANTPAEDEMDNLLSQYCEFGAEDSEPLNTVDAIYAAAKEGRTFPQWILSQDNPFELYSSMPGWEAASAALVQAGKDLYNSLLDSRKISAFNEDAFDNHDEPGKPIDYKATTAHKFLPMDNGRDCHLCGKPYSYMLHTNRSASSKTAEEYGEPSSEAMELAQRLIDIGDDIAYDVAAENGQILNNVKGMEWLVKAIAEEIAGDETTVREYLDNKDAGDDEFNECSHDHVEDDVCKDCGAELAPEEEGGHIAAAGDEQDEAVEMSLGFGDLADLAVNLPSQDKVASMSKTAEAMYTSKNFKSKKDLAAAVAMGRRITVYDPGYGMGGETPPPENGTCAVAGPHYPEPHRWYATVTLKDGIIVKVK